MADVRWLDGEQQQQWRAYLTGNALLQEALTQDLEANSGLSLNEYEVLVRLSEEESGRLRMSVLADSLVHSRSRLTHTVARMEKAGLVQRAAATCGDRRGVEAELTERGRAVLEAAAPAHVTSVRAHLVDVLTADQLRVLGEAFTAVAEAIAPQGCTRERDAERA